MPAIATDVMGSLAYIAQYFKKKKKKAYIAQQGTYQNYLEEDTYA